MSHPLFSVDATHFLTPAWVRWKDRELPATDVIALNPGACRLPRQPGAAFTVVIATRLRVAHADGGPPLHWVTGTEVVALCKVELRPDNTLVRKAEEVVLKGADLQDFRVVPSPEDPFGRFVMVASAVNFEGETGGSTKMVWREIDVETLQPRSPWTLMCPLWKAVRHVEKNWSPFVCAARPMATVRSDPWTVVDWNGAPVAVRAKTMDAISKVLRTGHPDATLRGGTQGVTFGPCGDVMFVVHVTRRHERRLRFVPGGPSVAGTPSANPQVREVWLHQRLRRSRTQYYSVFLVVGMRRGKLEVVGCTKLFLPPNRHTDDAYITFPTGLVLDDRDPSDPQWLVFYGEADVAARVVGVRHAEVVQRLLPPAAWAKLKTFDAAKERDLFPRMAPPKELRRFGSDVVQLLDD